MLDLRAISLMSLRVSTAAEPVEGGPESDPNLKPAVSASAPPPRRWNVTGLKVKAQIKVVQIVNVRYGCLSRFCDNCDIN